MSPKPKRKVKAKAKAPARESTSPQYRPEDLARAFRETYTPPPVVTTTTVALDPDVASHFRDSRAVNEALRALLRIVKQVRG